MDIPPQSAVLYKGKWSAYCDTVLVDCLVSMKGETHWTKPLFPRWFLLTAASEIKSSAEVTFSETELEARVEVLRSRYKTFKEVVASRGAIWDFPSKSVIASDEVWVKILKKNVFAGAYYHHEEPLYSKLACLCGMDDVKVENSPEVIVLSEDTEKLPSEELPLFAPGAVDEEVNSPATFPRPTVRRKLFEEERDTTDKESNTEMGVYFIDLAPDGQLRTRFEKGRALPKPPPPMQATAGQLSISPHGSSCGSNSPIGWWPQLQK